MNTLIVADPAPTASHKPVTVVPLAPRQQRRLRFFDALCEAGAEMVALGSTALTSIIESRDHDALHDRDVLAMRRLARRGASESAGVHRCACWQTFVLIDQRGASAQRHDDAEDGLITRAVGAVTRLVQLVRGLNRSLEREIAKRTTRRVRP